MIPFTDRIPTVRDFLAGGDLGEIIKVELAAEELGSFLTITRSDQSTLKARLSGKQSVALLHGLQDAVVVLCGESTK